MKSTTKTSSTSAPINTGKSSKSIVINTATLPKYKQCILDCTLNGKILKRPKDFSPVFEADYLKELINCNLRTKKLSQECQRNLAATALEKMGVVQVLFSTGCQRDSWFGAQKYCSSKGLVLASFDSKQKIGHFALYLTSQSRSRKLPEFSRNPLEIWVGGTNANRDNYFWIDTGQPVDAEITSGFVPQEKTQKCIYAYINSSDASMNWKESNCNSTFSFLCEVPKLCYFQKCKTKSQMRVAEKGVKLVGNCATQKCMTCQERIKADKNRTKDDGPENNGRYFTFLKKKYYASAVRRSYDDASLYCCKMQMNLWTWKSYDEGEKMISVLQEIGFKIYDYMLWHVNAKDEACDESYIWCDKQRRPIGADYMWLDSDPDDFLASETCIALGVSNEKTGFRDIPCYIKILFICESDDSSSILNMHQEIEIRPLRFDQNQECREKSRCIIPTKEMSPDSTLGAVIKASGRTYFVSKVTKNYWNAFTHCCSMGMHMATFDTYEEIDGIFQNYHFNLTWSDYRNARYYLTSSLFYKDDAVFWCSNNKPVNMSTIPFIFTEPNNAYPPEIVMGTMFLTFGKGLGDVNPYATWVYICQSPNKDP
ncbi:uncharacterized protein LOC132203499 [Neocloeon triangulifer]|uniref:uncharacterized protein LOC132203499 n=1 Tax=Neocloeon triangulifer TaxID=2078957 RepID=UPI00286EB7E2|nr:uncharacterized protein LOC132203499 [Neocloeon triangulifer]